MNPMYPCGKPCSSRTHNETVKKLALYSAIINEIKHTSSCRERYHRKNSIGPPEGLFDVAHSGGGLFREWGLIQKVK